MLTDRALDYLVPIIGWDTYSPPRAPVHHLYAASSIVILAAKAKPTSSRAAPLMPGLYTDLAFVTRDHYITGTLL